jgi:hypothetical protein
MSGVAQSRSLRPSVATSVLCALLLALAACSSGGLNAPSDAATMTVDPTTRCHNASESDVPIFVKVSFTPSTTFDQAIDILGGNPYPWTCDEPRSSTPPSIVEQRASFAATHSLFFSYPTWSQLTHAAASPHVISVDGVGLMPCS